jgi:hypothetical protein
VWEGENGVTERAQNVAVTLVGAVIGGLAGYLLFTEPGRQLRQRLEPALDDLVSELGGLQNTVGRAAGVAGEGWRLVTETFGDGGSQVRHANPRQTSPF